MTLAVGLVLLAVLAAVTLAKAPPRVLRAGTKQNQPFVIGQKDIDVCQGGEALPAGASSIRLAVWAFFGTPIHVTVSSGSRVLTEGRRGPAWTGSSVTVPIAPLRRSVSPVTVCAHLGPNSEALYLLGEQAPPGTSAVVSGRPSGGRMGIEFLTAGGSSWWSRIDQVARHMGLGRAFTGTWVAFLILALIAATGVLAVRVTLREST